MMFGFYRKLKSVFKVADLTIDLTGGHTVIYQQGHDSPIQVNEPAMLVIDGESCLAHGWEADNIKSQCPDGVRVVYPIKYGVVAEPNYCEQLLKHYFKILFKAKRYYCFYPDVLAVMPHDTTPSEQKTIIETMDAAGAKGVTLISSLQAAGRGIGYDRDKSGSATIINIARDFTEIGIISLNKIHYATTIRVGYDDFQKSIIEYARRDTEYTIGVSSAKKALDSIGVALYIPKLDDGKDVLLSGLLKRTSVPENLSLTKIQVHEAIKPLVERIIVGLTEVLEKSKEDMADDLRKNGVSIVGVGAGISRIDQAITKDLNIKAKVVEESMTCIAVGAGLIQGVVNK